MQKYTTHIVIVAILFMAACAQKITFREIYITNSIYSTPMPLVALEDKVLQQKITLKFNDEEHTVLGLVKLSSDNITVVAMSDFGRLFTIEYTDEGIRSELSPLAPFGRWFIPEYVINDIQLAYYPLSSLDLLPRGLTVTESGNRRIYVEDGKEIILIEYTAENRNSYSYHNLQRHYSYSVQEM
jgi:hypothetical protein